MSSSSSVIFLKVNSGIGLLLLLSHLLKYTEASQGTVWFDLVRNRLTLFMKILLNSFAEVRINAVNNNLLEVEANLAKISLQ